MFDSSFDSSVSSTQSSSAVRETVERLIDTSCIIDVEQIDQNCLPNRYAYRFFKRLFDIVASSLALIVLALPMLCIALIIKVTSAGPVFYKQERLGFRGKSITIVKFRSMYVDAEVNGAQWASEAGDPRITPIGRFLRATRIDELPQLVGVIKGDLSLVGPRPERPVFYHEFEKYIHGFSQRMLVKPGLTGLAQVNGGYDLAPSEKIVYDLEYIKEQGFLLDLRIIAKTIKVLFTHDGAR